MTRKSELLIKSRKKTHLHYKDYELLRYQDSLNIESNIFYNLLN